MSDSADSPKTVPAIIDADDGDLAIRVRQLREDLEQARTHSEVKGIADKAHLIAEVCRRLKKHDETRVAAIEVEVRAVRLIGVALLEHSDVMYGKTGNRGRPRLVLEDIDRSMICIARAIAAMPVSAFEDAIAVGRRDRNLSLSRCYGSARAVRGPSRPGAKSPGTHARAAKRLAKQYAKAPSRVHVREFLYLVRDSLKRILPKFADSKDRAAFMIELRQVIDDCESSIEKAAMGTSRFDDDYRAVKSEPRLRGSSPDTKSLVGSAAAQCARDR